MKQMVIGVATSFLIVVSIAHPRAQDPVSELDLSLLTVVPGLGGYRTFASAISELGHVVGGSATSDQTLHAFLWTRAGGIRDLRPDGGVSEAADVNDWGHVVGWFESEEGLRRPFVWRPLTGLRALPLFGGIEGVARAINNAGQILGRIDNEHVIWEPAGHVTRLQIPGVSFSVAYDLNEFGDVVVSSTAGLFRWSAQTGISAVASRGSVSDINERGDLAGIGDPGDGTVQPFLWTANRAQGLIPWISGERDAMGLNNNRQVVGVAEVPEAHPIGWDTMVYVWSAATGAVPLWPSNFEETYPHSVVDITDDGQVAGMLEKSMLKLDVTGTAVVLAQVATSAEQIAAAMRVRVTETARRALMRRGVDRALLARLDQFRSALREGRRTKTQARALEAQILISTINGGIPAAHALPLWHLARVLVGKSR
jgi:probable HAF family extracellular repeat protein